MYDLPDGIPQARLLCITMERKDQDTSLSSSEDEVSAYKKRAFAQLPVFSKTFSLSLQFPKPPWASPNFCESERELIVRRILLPTCLERLVGEVEGHQNL
jgi:hypothetical protein